MGVDWVPFGRADQAWIASEQLTGTQVAETDGFLQPPLTAWAGWVGERHAVLGGLAVAGLSSRVQTADQVESSARTGIRPSVDYRYYLKQRAVGAPIPYMQVGGFGVVPMAVERSDSATKSEQKVLDDQAQQDRSRIGSLGSSLGLGVELQWNNGFLIGARYSFVYHRSQSLDEETLTTSSLLQSEAALVFGFIL